LQGKRLIAQAKYAPGPRRTQPARDVQWENLLQPGDRRGR
jgi:hypothetical protein